MGHEDEGPTPQQRAQSEVEAASAAIREGRSKRAAYHFAMAACEALWVASEDERAAPHLANLAVQYLSHAVFHAVDFRNPGKNPPPSGNERVPEPAPPVTPTLSSERKRLLGHTVRWTPEFLAKNHSYSPSKYLLGCRVVEVFDYRSARSLGPEDGICVRFGDGGWTPAKDLEVNPASPYDALRRCEHPGCVEYRFGDEDGTAWLCGAHWDLARARARGERK